MENQNKKSIPKIPFLLLIGVVLFSLSVSAVSAANTSSNSTIYVSTEGNDTWDGLSPTYNTTSGPKKTITNATGTVTTNGTIYIAPGTYNESGITINKDMTITGENQENTIINGQQSGNSIFHILSGITANINNLTLTNNTAESGGAIYNKYGGNLTVTNCTFTNNTATGDGGAICNWENLTVTNCTFTNNTARSGGAIFQDGVISLTNCTFTNNTAACYGGVIYNDLGSLTVTNSTFADNAAEDGGVIKNSGDLSMFNCTFTNNTAANYGGAICNYGGLSVINSTFTNNTASNGNSGAIYNCVADASSVIVHFNRIIGNSPDNRQISSYFGIVDARFNWWGSNLDPSIYVSNGLRGIVDVSSWLVLNMTTNPDNISYGHNSTVTIDLLHDNTGTYHDPVNGHVPDGIHVDFTSDMGNLEPVSTVLVNGSATSVFTTTTIGSGNITATVDNQTVSTPIKTPSTITVDPVNGHAGQTITINTHITDSNGNPVNEGKVTYKVNGTVIGTVDVSNGLATINWTIPTNWTSGIYNIIADYSGSSNYLASTNGTSLTLQPSAYLYMNVTNSKNNPAIGEKFVLTYKLSNSGPDNATNVVISFQIPEGLEFVTASVDSGTYTYNPTNRTITWTLNNVKVGDPYLYLTLRALTSGKYTIIPTINSQTHNRNTDTIKPFNINIEAPNNNNPTTANAASNTITMQKTGTPTTSLILAILAILGGILTPKKK